MRGFLEGKILRSIKWNLDIFAILKDETIVYMCAEENNVLSELKPCVDKTALTIVVDEEFMEYPRKDPKVVWQIPNNWNNIKQQ